MLYYYVVIMLFHLINILIMYVMEGNEIIAYYWTINRNYF